jgi:uncharacterized protein (TIGR02118 family)
MIKITVFYPLKENDWFDLKYYSQKHATLSKSIFGDSLRGLVIEEAYSYENSDAQDFPYKVIGHLFFDHVDDFYARYLPNKDLLTDDAKNYTNVNPVIQISKVIVWE